MLTTMANVATMATTATTTMVTKNDLIIKKIISFFLYQILFLLCGVFVDSFASYITMEMCTPNNILKLILEYLYAMYIENL